MLINFIREKNKPNIKSRKYGQVKLRASKRGIYSCLFALGCYLCLGILVYIAYATYGEVPSFAGSLGFVAIIHAGLGIFYGFSGFRERERSYRTCKIGIGLNSLIIVLFIILFVRGLF